MSELRIISRAEWGARHDNGGGPAPLPASEVWLHHSVTVAPDLVWIDADGDNVEDDEERAMRQLEDIGEQRFGRGISYTWAIMPSGRAHEGHSVDRLGAHTGGRNGVARAIVFVGNYQTHQPTRAQIVSAARLLQHAKAKGWIKEARLRGGHRDVLPMTGDSIATTCPGDHAYAVIGEINRLAAGPPITEEDDDVSAQDIWNYPIPDAGAPGQPAPGSGVWPAWAFLRNGRADIAATRASLRDLAEQVTKDNDGVDTDALLARIDERFDQARQETDAAVRQAIADGVLDVEVTVQDKTAAQ